MTCDLIISLYMNFNYPQTNITVKILRNDLESVVFIYRLSLEFLQYAGLEVETGKSSGETGFSQNQLLKVPIFFLPVEM